MMLSMHDYICGEPAITRGNGAKIKINIIMRLTQISKNPNDVLIRYLSEGGWNSTATQGTVITPEVVRSALTVVGKFVEGFNRWLASNGHQPVEIGHPLGSTAHHTKDPDDKVYGDIDLQMIAPDAEGTKTPSQFAAHWNKLLDQYVSEVSPSMIYDQGKDSGGHVVLSLGDGKYVQVDMLWTNRALSNWMRYRMTPAHNIKGATYGNLFSTLGEIMHISIQSAGAQMKIKDGEPVPFAKSRKYDSLETLTTNIETFGLDLLKKLYERMHPGKDPSKAKIDPMLAANPGINPEDITASRLVSVIKGLGKSFEANNMFGRFNLKDISDYDDFVSKFKSHYMDKIRDAAAATKFDKAETPEAKARAEDAKNKLLSNGTAIMGLF